MKQKSKNGLEEVNPDFVKMYYEHQYDRMGKLEDQTLMVTNVVTALSILAFTFSLQGIEDLNIIRIIGLAFVILVANLFAIGYIKNSQMFIALHQKRAMKVLDKFSPYLSTLNNELPWPSKDAWKARRIFHILLHSVFSLAALSLLVYYFIVKT